MDNTISDRELFCNVRTGGYSYGTFTWKILSLETRAVDVNDNQSKLFHKNWLEYT